MDHALLVGVLERVGDLFEEPDRLGHRQLALAGEPAPEGFPLDQRHDVVDLAGGLARIESRQDVGMLPAGGGADFLEEAVGAEHDTQLRAEDLDRDGAAVAEVVRAVDRGHPAGAEGAARP